MKPRYLFGLLLCVLVIVALGGTPASAYERWKNDAEDPGSNCSACHGNFTDTVSPTGANIPTNKHEMHRSSSYMNADCDLCHTSGDSRNPYLGSSNGTSDNAGFGCVGCHGRAEDAGNDVANSAELSGPGAGLRQHHQNSGIPTCANCHDDSDPADYTPVGENVKPPYYDTVDTRASMPCNPVATANLNENWTIGDFLGLDNDGDGIYDGSESECQSVAACPDDDNDGYAVCGPSCEPATEDQCGDCDDTDATVNPDGIEGPNGDLTCSDGLDNDCDTLVDEADTDCDPVVASCPDNDVDGYVVCDGECQVPVDAQCGDCDDTDPNLNPGATEVCDGVDNDCDTLVDDDDPDVADQSTWYADGDSDTYGDAGDSVLACEMPSGYVANDSDCNDAVAAVNPGATEVCDEVDNDCDTLIDDADPGVTGQSTWYADSDSDTYGNPGMSQEACTMPSDYVSDNTDCNDAMAAVNPAATEVCDGIDNDCDTLVDDADPGVTGQFTWYADSDSDGYGNPGMSQEVCTMPAGYVSDDTDCDDTLTAVNPAAAEGPSTDPTCSDGLDNDCDTAIDGADPGCEATVVFCEDNDDDGYAACGGGCELPPATQCGDCDDTNPALNPGATEVCDGIDNDCDTLIDDADSDVAGQSTWYADSDSDTYGNPAMSQAACTMPSGYVSDDTDCDDTMAAVNPGAAEGPSTDPSCADGEDNDCDALIDGLDPGCEVGVVFCPDNDADGYAVCDASCEPVPDTRCGDCDDADAAVNPGATEGPSTDPSCSDGADNDCDTLIDEADPACEPAPLCPDDDGDGFAVCDDVCDLPFGLACGDCDDTDTFVNPGAVEGPYMDPTCYDGADNDCDGFADSGDSACLSPMLSDYDIVWFKCSKTTRVGKRISLRLMFENQGGTDPGAELTVYGMREDGATIPIVMGLEVFDPVGHGRTRRTFTYTAQTEDTGELTWYTELTDETPGVEDDAQDTAVCQTTVGGKPFGKAKGHRREGPAWQGPRGR